MKRAILIGLVAGQRAMTPLAAVATAARRGDLPEGAFARDFLADPAVAGAAAALAALEMAGDKMKSAPDRTVFAGLLARTLTASFAGTVLAPKGKRGQAAVIAVWTAIAASHAGLALRRKAIDRFGQTATGVVEDAAAMATALAVATSARRSTRLAANASRTA